MLPLLLIVLLGVGGTPTREDLSYFDMLTTLDQDQTHPTMISEFGVKNTENDVIFVKIHVFQ